MWLGCWANAHLHMQELILCLISTEPDVIPLKNNRKKAFLELVARLMHWIHLKHCNQCCSSHINFDWKQEMSAIWWTASISGFCACISKSGAQKQKGRVRFGWSRAQTTFPCSGNEKNQANATSLRTYEDTTFGGTYRRQALVVSTWKGHPWMICWLVSRCSC